MRALQGGDPLRRRRGRRADEHGRRHGPPRRSAAAAGSPPSTSSRTFRLAELLGAPSLHAEGRRPVSTPVVDLAVRRIIHDNPGLYAGVQHHQSTVVALRDLYRELRRAGAGSITALARTERGGEPARVAAEVARRLRTDWYDEGDLLARAVERARHRAAGPVPPPRRPPPAAPAPARAAAPPGHRPSTAPSRSCVGTTGDPVADAGVLDLAAALAGGPLDGRPGATAAGRRARGRVDHRRRRRGPRRRPHRRRRRSPRHAVRPHRRALPGRAALRPPRRAPPRRRRRPVERPAGHRRRRADGAAGPRRAARPRPARAAPQRPDDAARRRAGPPARRHGRADGAVGARGTGGRRRPGGRLGVAPPALRRRGPDRRPVGRRRRRGRRARPAGVRRGPPPPTSATRAATRRWAEWVAWSTAMLEHWFGAGRLDGLDGAEGRAWEQTSRVLDRLAHLDGIGPPVTRAEFRSTFVAELEVTPGRHGTIGDGVHVSTLAGAAGIDVDLVVVLGAAEGLLPPGPTIDPLVGDHERELAGLAPSDELTGLVHRQFLAAVTTTPAAVVTVPRGDLRVTAARYPSRWLTPFLERARERVVDSHAHGVAATAFPASPDEHRLRALWTGVRAGADVRRLDLAVADPVLSRALALRDARASDRFTAYDGNVAGHHLGPLPPRVSPTRMAAWPACPHAYFVQLRAGRAAGRGARGHRDAVGGRPRLGPARRHRPAPPRRARRASCRRPTATGGATCTSMPCSRAGERGRRRPRGERAHRSRRVLGQRPQVAADRVPRPLGRLRRASSGAAARCWRRSYAFGDDRPVPVAIPGGRTIGFAGIIDRVDELPDGTLRRHRPQDGQAGRASPSCRPRTRRSAARRFQLPVYAAAARHVLGRPAAAVEAAYTFFKPFKRVTVRFDDDVSARVGAALGLVVDGIEAGCFPPRPSAARLAQVPCRAGSASPTGSAPPRAGRSGSASATIRCSRRGSASPTRPTSRAARRELSSSACSPRRDDEPPDQAARELIRTATGTTLFVEAGAGAGKTTALVGRILTLVDEGIDDRRHRRHHVHREGGRRAPPPPAARARRRSTDDTAAGRPRRPRPRPDRHAPRVRPPHPVRAARRGRPAAGVHRARRPRERARPRRALGGPPRRAPRRRRPRGRPGPAGRRARAARSVGHVQRLPRAAARHRGLPGQLGPRRAPRRPRPARRDRRTAVPCSPASPPCATPVPPDDRQAGRPARRRRRRSPASGRRRRSAPSSTGSASCESGSASRDGSARQANWQHHGGARGARGAARRGSRGRRPSSTTTWRRGGATARRSSVRSAAGSCSTAPTARAAAGTLEFHDLLVLARRLLATDDGARRRLHERYQRLLLDEFQDTDSDPARDRRAADRADPIGQPRHDIAGLRPIARPAVRRRRPQAVDLPLPPRRHRDLPRRGRPARRHDGHAVGELPLHRCRHRLGQRRVRRRSSSPSRDVQPAYGALDACRPGPRGHGTVRVLGTDGARRRRRRRRRAAPAGGGVGRRRHRHGAARGLAGRRRRRAACDRAARATSPCCCRPARRCRCWRARSPPWPCRTAPRTPPSCTSRRRSATSCWRCAPRPTRPMASRSWPPCARRCTAAATSSC